MTLNFNIEYRTNWGEKICVLGNLPELGSMASGKELELSTIDGIHWTLSLDINIKKNLTLEYLYCVKNDSHVVRYEWDSFKRNILIHKSTTKKDITFWDSWKNIPTDLPFYSSAFTDSLLKHKKKTSTEKKLNKSIILKVNAPYLSKDYTIGVTGNQKQFNFWDADKAVMLQDSNFPEWSIELDASKLQYPFEYKFVLFNNKSNELVCWENSSNRVLYNPHLSNHESLILSAADVDFNIPAVKCAGVAVPVFSLKSNKSFGVGDFGDLKQMIHWASLTHQKIVQILPINDTTITGTWTDSYPYNSISIYAFHPMYLDLNQLPALKQKSKVAYFTKLQKQLNDLEEVDYELVNKYKWEYILLSYQQDGKAILKTKKYKDFFEANKEWLKPYAAFSYLRDKYSTANFREWPALSVYDKKKVCVMTSAHGGEEYAKIEIYFYLQYQLHLQLQAASKYAHQKGVVLKGDIPIGISRNSVEAWAEPHYFCLNGQAGAPPDDFSINGQNWGFPTYNWEVMANDGYSWWKKRFQKMAEYFDAYRIDHILGFFRIWEIPMNAVHGLLGQFVPALPMSKEEIEGYGLYFNEEKFTKPYIHESFLNNIFGPLTDFVKEHFIDSTNTWELYKMKPEFETQRDVEVYFEGKTDPDSIRMRDGLYSLISNVLFVRDRTNKDMYHPRIAVQHEYIYQSLSESDKEAFNRLYDDYFYRRHNQFWYESAMKKLPELIGSTKMLVCAEDLGMIPDCVQWVINDLRILSLEIQRMPKDSSFEFAPLYQYPYYSVCTISTHDMSTFRGWWKEDKSQTQKYYNFELNRWGDAPEEASAEICQQAVEAHLNTNSMLCVLSFQDWLSVNDQLRNPEVEKERINVPANPRHYWRYRMHLTLDELLKAKELNNQIKELISNSGRNVI